jgi:8-oxo-dGTP pyrophosphatase MutT (NUDIX family)
LRLVLASRADPPLPLARLRARGQLAELREGDLRFAPGEAAELLQAAVGPDLPAAAVAALTERTEGWVAGLQLAGPVTPGSGRCRMDAFYLPGGKREPGESDAQALAREVHEELGVRLRLETLSLAGVFTEAAHGYPGGRLVRLVGYRAGYQERLRPGAEVAEARWVSHADRPGRGAEGGPANWAAGAAATR